MCTLINLHTCHFVYVEIDFYLIPNGEFILYMEIDTWISNVIFICLYSCPPCDPHHQQKHQQVQQHLQQQNKDNNENRPDSKVILVEIRFIWWKCYSFVFLLFRTQIWTELHHTLPHRCNYLALHQVYQQETTQRQSAQFFASTWKEQCLCNGQNCTKSIKTRSQLGFIY